MHKAGEPAVSGAMRRLIDALTFALAVAVLVVVDALLRVCEWREARDDAHRSP